MHSPGARISLDHARHDRLLVARFAADDAYPGERAEAEALVARCATCAGLAAEIRLIRAAVADLPAPRRTRDFRLTQEQADELRGSRLTRVLRRLAAPGGAPLRPLAGVAMSLGIALAVVGTTMPTPAALDYQQNSLMQMERGLPAAGGDPGAPTMPGFEAPEVGVDNGVSGEEGQAPVERDPLTADSEQDVPVIAAAEDDSGLMRDLLIYAGLVIALVSLGALIAFTFIRRRWRDPLLR